MQKNLLIIIITFLIQGPCYTWSEILKAVNPQALAMRSGDTEILIIGGSLRNDGYDNHGQLIDLSNGSIVSSLETNISHTEGQIIQCKNGNILLIGGYDKPGRSSKVVELFDVSDKRIYKVGELQESRANHCATVLPNGNILVTGGKNELGGVLNSAELIDSKTFTSTRLNSKMLYSRLYHTSTLLKDGNVLITGGGGGQTAEIFYFENLKFNSVINLNEPRIYHTATLLDDGRVFIFSNGRGELFIPQKYKFEEIPGTWEPPIRERHSATLLPSGKVLIVGGGASLYGEALFGAPLIFDGSKGSFTALEECPHAKRVEHVALPFGSGVLLIGNSGMHEPHGLAFFDEKENQFLSLSEAMSILTQRKVDNPNQE